MNWLRRNFGGLNEDSIEVQREQHTGVYILMIIRGHLMPDKLRNIVHLRWLLKLINFKEAVELSWGSIVLMTLYREMCRAAPKVPVAEAAPKTSQQCFFVFSLYLGPYNGPQSGVWMKEEGEKKKRREEEEKRRRRRRRGREGKEK
ncbi:hypothetical protein J1N35_000111 [Gossypium stocksii]|uniref:Aminotransferase-like plant mobile domain-containing protein n=1 Tax=Gossypium stocksii TaxID=47602 RepID=A0A9D4AKH2_9ROSI|nr:hypothetical protein J1N35_000111 [Gossypium stocksii]